MDLSRLKEQDDPFLTGSLLVAHPGLNDPNFARTVILLSAHDPDEGALGVILNRPTGRTLGQLFPGHEALTGLETIEIFAGGPVQNENLILAGWRWNQSDHLFRMHFGIDHTHLGQLLASGEVKSARGFLGYAGWTSGQLEAELKMKSWLTHPITQEAFNHQDSDEFWREMVGRSSEVSSLQDFQQQDSPPFDLPSPPEDPELN